MAKVVLLGLDGATFSLLDPLLQGGRLPQLARLVREGVRGPLRSTIHPLTPAAWTSCVTGLNPGKHGIYDFRRRRAGSYVLEPVNARRRDGAPLWDILNERGLRAGVFNVPMTYPAEAVNGFMVSGMDTPGVESAFVHPPELQSALLAAVPGYQIDLDEGTDDEDTFLERLQHLAAVELRALDWLIERHPDLSFLMAVFVAIDRLYHTFWHYLEPGQPGYASAAAAARVRTVHEELLRGMDGALGRLRLWAGDEATFVVVSDHGFGPLYKDVYMNRVLQDAGFLRFREDGAGKPFADAVDWQHTQAYAFGFFGNINLNLRGREPSGCVEQGKEASDVLRALAAALRALRDPEDGQPLVDEVYRREDLYSGPHVGDAPDLLVVMRNYAYMTRDGYETERGRVLGAPMARSTRRLVHTGNHRLDGVFIMAGPGVRGGEEITGARIIDVAPTVLYALGLPRPGVMDGSVLRAAYSGNALAERPPRVLLSALPPISDARACDAAAAAQQIAELERKAERLESDKNAAAAYAHELERTLALKDAHIGALEATLAQRERALDAYQRSVFFRAWQRWQRLMGRLK